MKLSIRILCSAALAASAFASRGAAQVVVNGGAPNEGIGWNIFDDNRAATQFSLDAPVAFSTIRFWGLLPAGPLYAPTMYWEILENDGAGPGAVAASGSAVANAVVRKELDAFPGFFSWQFDIDAGAHSLATGPYWLALHDGPLDASVVSGSSLIWETTDAVGQYETQTFSVDETWSPVDSGLAFELRNDSIATPEPGALSLLAIGLLSMLVVARFKEFSINAGAS